MKHILIQSIGFIVFAEHTTKIWKCRV